MRTGNVEGQRPAFESNRATQRRKDNKNNTCFLCHKRGCRPWKRADSERVNTNNVNLDEENQKPESEKWHDRLWSWRPLVSDNQWVANKASSQERQLTWAIISDLGISSPIQPMAFRTMFFIQLYSFSCPTTFCFRGTLNRIAVNAVKDEGCNTNLISSNFSRRNKDKFIICKANITVDYSLQHILEVSSKNVLNGIFSIWLHSYTSNWIGAKCRYNVLLDMPWKMTNTPCIDYVGRVVRVSENDLSVEGCQHDTDDNMCKVPNMSVKSFRKILRKRDYQRMFKCFKSWSKMDVTASND